jgi:hypothetical protein
MILIADDVARAVDALKAERPDAWISIDGLFRITEADAARMIGIKPRTLRAWREQGRAPAFHDMGARPTYAIADVLAWAKTRRYDPAEYDLGSKCHGVAERG